MGTVYGMPKPQKDFNKLMRNQGRQVRCRAQLITDSPIDSTREFMITYFLEDDTIQIYEDSKRNSGITGGNFLKRGKYTNTSPLDGVPRPFVPTDIFLGNEISLIGVKMRIIEMDNMTLRFCENYPDEFPMMDTFKIVNGLVSKVLNQRINLCAYFASVDRARAGYVNQAQFVEGLDALGLIEDLNDQEVLTILRRFKSQDKYDYEELNDLFSFSYNKMVMEGKAARPLRDPLSEIESGDLRDFLRLLRRRNNQWRR